MSESRQKPNWALDDIKTATEKYIDHVNNYYYKSYLQESADYERTNNILFMLVTIIGFLVTILLGLKSMLPFENETPLNVAAFILPSLSSVIMVYISQKGLKRKEELRENARIHCKFLVNKAKVDFAMAKTDDDFKAIYLWLNEETLKLQLQQANDYFVVHNNTTATVQSQPTTV